MDWTLGRCRVLVCFACAARGGGVCVGVAFLLYAKTKIKFSCASEVKLQVPGSQRGGVISRHAKFYLIAVKAALDVLIRMLGLLVCDDGVHLGALWCVHAHVVVLFPH